MSEAKASSSFKDIISNLLKNPYKYANQISVKDLVDLMKQLSYYYYNTDQPLVPDEIYDILKNILQERDPTNKYLGEIGVQVAKKEKVKLPYFMPSLEKIKPSTDALSKWIKKFKGPYVLSDKLDGVSGLLVKEGDDKFKLYTRGDGKEGQDISHLIKYIFSKEKINLNTLPDNTAIRGELIISKKNFKKIEKEFKNARNAVAGLVNAKHYSLSLAKLTNFIGYSLLNPKMKMQDQIVKMNNWHFPTVNNMTRSEISNDFLSDYLKKRRSDSEYEIDGIVVIDSSSIYPILEKNPEYGFAFKTILTDQIAEVIVLDVDWNLSKDGYLVPRVILEPVTLTGVTIKYATAFNAKFVEDNKLGPGAVIKLIRSGDVIPHILEVIKPAIKTKMPDIPYKWTKSGVNIIAKDIFGSQKDEVIIKQISFFFKKMGVKFISKEIVRKIVDSDYKDLISILEADKDDLADIEGLGTKMVEKIFVNIKNSFKTLTLQKLMAASNLFGRGLGEKKINIIVNAYPNILTIDWDNKTLTEKILLLEGFDKITTNQFVENLPEFKKFYKKLEDSESPLIDLTNIKQLLVKPKKKAGTKFEGMKIVFSGIRDKKLEEEIINNGGEVTGTVSKNTSVLIYLDKTTSKYLKAIELKIPTMTIEEFKNKY